MESTWTQFVKFVTGKKYSLKELTKLFNMVDKEDYLGNEKERLLKYVLGLQK